MEYKRNRILKSGDRTEWDQDRGRESKGSAELADFSRSQKYKSF